LVTNFKLIPFRGLSGIGVTTKLKFMNLHVTHGQHFCYNLMTKVNIGKFPLFTLALVLFQYTFTNTHFGKSIALFLLVLLTNTIPHVGWYTIEILNTLV